MICNTCKTELDPRTDAIVYLSGCYHDERSLTVALCAPKSNQINSGSPCVNHFRAFAEDVGLKVIPAEEEDMETSETVTLSEVLRSICEKLEELEKRVFELETKET
jgi:hypothetical protein